MNQEFTKLDYYHGLAAAFLRKELSLEEQQEVFQLILTEPEFCECLRLELALRKKFQKNRSTLSAEAKKTLYRKITHPSRTYPWLELLNIILQQYLWPSP